MPDCVSCKRTVGRRGRRSNHSCPLQRPSSRSPPPLPSSPSCRLAPPLSLPRLASPAAQHPAPPAGPSELLLRAPTLAFRVYRIGPCRPAGPPGRSSFTGGRALTRLHLRWRRSDPCIRRRRRVAGSGGGDGGGLGHGGGGGFSESRDSSDGLGGGSGAAPTRFSPPLSAGRRRRACLGESTRTGR